MLKTEQFHYTQQSHLGINSPFANLKRILTIKMHIISWLTKRLAPTMLGVANAAEAPAMPVAK